MMKGWLGSGEWILPGGGLHKNEDVIVGAIRELREETSLELASSQLKVVGEGLGREHGLKFHYVVLSASLPARLPFKIQQQEVSEIAWLPLEKIGDFPISPLSRELLTTWTKF
jgi:ADP-ribose pyrophosphatase YjhB (NUDIX family)